jgi:chondroitin synthase
MQCNPIVGLANDYTFIDYLKKRIAVVEVLKQRVSVVIPYYKRQPELINTLEGLALQTIPSSNIEVIIVDDGGNDLRLDDIRKELRDSFFSIRIFTKKREGFQLSRVRNIGIRAASCEYLIIIDADIFPQTEMLQRHLECLMVSKRVISIGFRASLDVSDMTPAQMSLLPLTKDQLDWRIKKYFRDAAATTAFKLGDTYWGACSGGNIAFHRSSILKDELFFDEGFTFWGGEDTAWAYEAYKSGYYFYPNFEALSIHQEGISSSPVEYKKDRQRVSDYLAKLCPRIEGVFSTPPLLDLQNVPFVSFWITSYNNARYIREAIESLKGFGLRHEIVIVDDGSTDASPQIIADMLAEGKGIRALLREHKGAAHTFNDAIKLCRGEFIVQLDSDDRIKSFAAIEDAIFKLTYQPYGLAYGKYELIREDGSFLEEGWRYPYCSRDEALLEGMRMHPPRVLRLRDVKRSRDINTSLTSAVDYDLYSKVLECTYGIFTDKCGYSYRKHSASITNTEWANQGDNTRLVVEDKLTAIGIFAYAYNSSKNPRKNTFSFKDGKARSIDFLQHLALTEHAVALLDEALATCPEQLVDSKTMEIDGMQRNISVFVNGMPFRFEV